MADRIVDGLREADQRVTAKKADGLELLLSVGVDKPRTNLIKRPINAPPRSVGTHGADFDPADGASATSRQHRETRASGLRERRPTPAASGTGAIARRRYGA